MLGFGKPKVNDPYNTMGAAGPKKTAPAPKKPVHGGIRPRTDEDDARYDEISRNAIKNKKPGKRMLVDPAVFTSTVDYLKWCDRVGEPGAVWDASLPTGGVITPSIYDEVKKLRGR